MDTGRQVLRWSIPGAVFVLYTITVVIVFDLVTSRHAPNVEDVPASLVAAAIGASVPIGFLIYQAYFSLYNGMFPGLKRAPLDRGRDVLSYLPDGVVEKVSMRTHWKPDLTERTVETASPLWGKRCSLPDRSRKTRHLYALQTRQNHVIVRVLIDVLADEEGKSNVKYEYTSHNDIYHAQGATIFAVLCGLASGLAYVAATRLLEPGDSYAISLVAILVILGVTIAVTMSLLRARAFTLQSTQERLKFMLQWACHAPESQLFVAPPEGGSEAESE